MMLAETPFWMLWWVWCAGALALAILEVLVPGFVFLGFALGALAGGVLLLVFGGAGLGLPALLLVFAALSLAAWLLMRRFFALPTGQVKSFDHDINDG
jgi:membrane protein implicated in regulation of membrane protease activity